MKRCKICNTINHDKAAICSGCRSSVRNSGEFAYICNTCGRVYRPADAVCPKCGSKPGIVLRDVQKMVNCAAAQADRKQNNAAAAVSSADAENNTGAGVRYDEEKKQACFHVNGGTVSDETAAAVNGADYPAGTAKEQEKRCSRDEETAGRSDTEQNGTDKINSGEAFLANKKEHGLNNAENGRVNAEVMAGSVKESGCLAEDGKKQDKHCRCDEAAAGRNSTEQEETDKINSADHPAGEEEQDKTDAGSEKTAEEKKTFFMAIMEKKKYIIAAICLIAMVAVGVSLINAKPEQHFTIKGYKFMRMENDFSPYGSGARFAPLEPMNKRTATSIRTVDVNGDNIIFTASPNIPRVVVYNEDQNKQQCKFETYDAVGLEGNEIITSDRNIKFWLIKTLPDPRNSDCLWIIHSDKNGCSVAFDAKKELAGTDFAGGKSYDSIAAGIADGKILLTAVYHSDYKPAERINDKAALLTWDESKKKFYVEIGDFTKKKKK